MKSAAQGRALADALIVPLQERAAVVAHARRRPATLAIVAAADEDGRRFVRIKQAALADVPLEIVPVWLTPDTTTADASAAIERLNARADVDAIFLQFPLPPAIAAQSAADAVQVSKDVDCSSRLAEGEFLAGGSAFVPVAPQAACHLLQHELGSLEGRSVLIAGSDDPFVRALRKLLQDAGARLALPSARSADALVITEVLPSPERLAEFERLGVLLDAGYYLPPRPQEWLSPAVRGRIGVLLTQYGNVGPLTVAYLAQATIRAAELADIS
jgi:5,10-methylene-tetrahydrofolate dehydrogenase/methenyl tetrahydrofolate cyclohydrolase